MFDAETHKPLAGVAVYVRVAEGTATDTEGRFMLQAQEGDTVLHARMIGYHEQIYSLKDKKATDTIEIRLSSETSLLGETVITATRNAIPIETATVSVEVLGSQRIENQPQVSAEDVVSRVPGVHITDGQVSIRGGSGFSYGAGSRVLVLVDDMPAIAGDAGDVKWSFLPMGNLEKVEVVKGASSALYGSSALNGVIHLRTIQPADTPATKLCVLAGIYGNPVRHDSLGNRSHALKWWEGANPVFGGVQAMHARKWKGGDWVVSGQAHQDQGYREGEHEKRVRLGASVRYNLGSRDQWRVGLALQSMWIDGSLFLLWQDADSGAWKPAGGVDPATTTLNFYQGSRLTIDPTVQYTGGKGGKHAFRNRLFRVVNHSETGQGAISTLSYHEYQYQWKGFEHWTLTGGAVVSFNTVKAEFYGDHDARNLAGFFQADRSKGRWNVSAGLRLEYFRMDTATSEAPVYLPGGFRLVRDRSLVSDSVRLLKNSPVRPVIRLGVNYRVIPGGFMRASLGGGYRFPSVAEKFVSTEVGGLKIFPNPALQPETGWSTELGYRQMWSKGQWKGGADVALFWTEYQNMMEFTFGQYYPDSIKNPDLLQYLAYSGFRSENIGNARISGAEISLFVQPPTGPLKTSCWLGYTYTNAKSLAADSSYIKGVSDPESNLLKYRFRHLLKGECTIGWKHWTAGIQTVFHSAIENVDKSFEEPLLGNIPSTKLLPGLKEYRDEHNRGVWVWEARCGWEFYRSWTAIISIRNLFNIEYMERPGDIQAPRTVLFQIKTSF
ncbi:MAG: TonB-dependent receptor [Flavobacteriales bacterium]|nr:TonB-dependent receptor [Flavobacteriales bacterium]